MFCQPKHHQLPQIHEAMLLFLCCHECGPYHHMATELQDISFLVHKLVCPPDNGQHQLTVQNLRLLESERSCDSHVVSHDWQADPPTLPALRPVAEHLYSTAAPEDAR